jgi:hypothetical protein
VLISVLLPTITDRERRLERTLATFKRVGGPLEYIVELDDGGSNWGSKIAKCAERAGGDYIFCCADDIDVHEGWWQAATAVCDAGAMPAPLVFNTDGSIQSCGNSWAEKAPDGSEATWSRFPFLSRAQWERFGPTLPIHYSDVILGQRAAREGVKCRVTHGFALTHHFAPEQRKDHDIEHLRMIVANQLDERGIDLWDPEVREAINNCTPRVEQTPHGPLVRMVRE